MDTDSYISYDQSSVAVEHGPPAFTFYDPWSIPTSEPPSNLHETDFGVAVRNNASYSELSCSPLQYGTRMDFQSSAAVEGGPVDTWVTTWPAVGYPRYDRQLPGTAVFSHELL